MNPVLSQLDRAPRTLLLLAALVLTAVVTSLGYVAPDWSVSLLYLVPIALVAGPLGLRAALLVSVASAGGMALSEFRGTMARIDPMHPWWDTSIHFVLFALTSVLLVRLRGEMAREERLARVDPTTGAANRRAFLEDVEAEMARAARYGKPFTVGILDLDNFKAINDTRGHAAGDDALRAVVEVLHQHLRAVDVVARLGGDEFGVILPETAEEGAAFAFAKLQDGFAAAMRAGGWPLNFSAGVIVYNEPPRTVSEALKDADDLMYRAKRTGKGGVVTGTRPARDLSPVR
jgi:diguanylate cyclase (GGDEF)-like protein